MKRVPGPDWKAVGWHYRLIHRTVPPWHNPLWMRTKGTENIPREGGAILASNHTSWWDPILVSASVGRPVAWLAKKEVGKNRFGNWFFFERGGCIPVDRNTRNPEAFAAAADALHEGRLLGIFPESTRFVGQLGPFKRGAARLALQTRAPVVPTACLTDRFWPPGQALPNWTQKVYVRFGEPLTFDGDPSDAKTVQDVTDRLAAAVGALLEEARGARDAKAKWTVP